MQFFFYPMILKYHKFRSLFSISLTNVCLAQFLGTKVIKVKTFLGDRYYQIYLNGMGSINDLDQILAHIRTVIQTLLERKKAVTRGPSLSQDENIVWKVHLHSSNLHRIVYLGQCNYKSTNFLKYQSVLYGSFTSILLGLFPPVPLSLHNLMRDGHLFFLFFLNFILGNIV